MKKEDKNKKEFSDGAEPAKKKNKSARKFFKWFGFGMAGIIGMFGIAFAVAAISGAYSDKKISVTSLTWEQDKMRVVDDFYAKINYKPDNANQLEVELSLKYPQQTSDIVEIPEKVTAGVPFLIKVKKDAKGNNIGGEVVISAKTNLVVSSSNLQVLVDVAIPNDGLIIASDFDAVDGNGNNINAGANEFGMYVFTDPNKALNPNTGLTTDLLQSYKNIKLKSSDSISLSILDNGTEKEGFYCPKYKESGHAPFVEPDGTNQICPICEGQVQLQRMKYIKYRAKALTSSLTPVYVTAQALRTYSMQEDYVDMNDSKYLESGQINRQMFFNDLSNYIDKYQDLIKKDTRKFSYAGGVNYNNGAEFIASVTIPQSNGGSKVKINDNDPANYNATLFYLFIEAKTIFNIKEIAIDKVETTLGSGEAIDFKLHEATTQLNLKEFTTLFGVKLVPTNTTDFTSDDLSYRIREMKIMCIKDKALDSTNQYNYDPCNYVFDITNPSDLTNPIWKITCINPISSLDASKNVRLRIYVPTSADGEFNEKCKYLDYNIYIKEIGVDKLEFSQTNPINTNMVINNQNIGTAVHRQILDQSCYVLKGAGNETPTYNTVKFFVYADSAKTVGEDGTTPTNYFKIKLNNTGAPPQPYQMAYGSENVSAYEIAYSQAGKIYLEALNVSGKTPVRLFAAVVKTDFNNIPVDSNGKPQFIFNSQTNQYDTPNPDFIGYVLIEKTKEVVEISTTYYLESINLYTKNDVIALNPTYDLRNVSRSTISNTIQLLAENDYRLYATGYDLTTTGEFNADYSGYVDKTIDYKSNIKSAMDNAVLNEQIYFKTDNSQEAKEYINLIDEKTYMYNKDTGMFEINLVAFIDKDATSPVTGTFDLRAYGRGLLADSLNSIISSVNMKVNYATLTGLNFININNSPINNVVTLKPQITSVTSGQSSIEWREKDVNQEFSFSLDYGVDILNQSPDNIYTSTKIDKSYVYDSYVKPYAYRILNPSETSLFNVKWVVTFEDGSMLDASNNRPSDYLTISHDEDFIMDGEFTKYVIIPKLNIKKGTETGKKIVINCYISLYKTNTSSEYIQTITKAITLDLVQSNVTFQLYSPKTKLGVPILAVNNVGKKSSLVLDGGSSVDLLADLTPGNEKGIQVFKAVGTDPDDYSELIVDGNTVWSTQLIIANLVDDGRLANFCKYTIPNFVTGDIPLYFLTENEEGKMVRTGESYPTIIETPDGSGGVTRTYQLNLFADFTSSSRECLLEITSPFGGAVAKYNVYVNSSIVVSGPSTNIVTSTTNDNYKGSSEITKQGLLNLSDYFSATKQATKLPISFEIDGNYSNFGSLMINDSEIIKSVTLTDGRVKSLYTIFKPIDVYSKDGETVKLKLKYYLPEVIDGQTKYTEQEILSINNKEIALLVKNGYKVSRSTNATDDMLYFDSGVTHNLLTQLDLKNIDSTITIKDYIIKLLNLNGNTDATTGALLKELIHMEFGSIEESKLAAFNEAFGGDVYINKITGAVIVDISAIPENEKPNYDKVSRIDAIKFGKLNSNTISTNLTVPVVVYFKEGASNVVPKGGMFTINITIKASVSINFGGENIENINYTGPKNGNTITDTIVVGHEFSKINANIVANKIEVKNSVQELYNSTKYDSNNKINILQISGGYGEDLLHTKYIGYKIYKFNTNLNSYIEINATDIYSKFNINIVGSTNALNSISIVLKNAVNEVENYRLSIITTLAENYYSYYFTLNPIYKLKTNYPVDLVEKVLSSSKINLLGNYINENPRIQLFTGNDESNPAVTYLVTGTQPKYYLVGTDGSNVEISLSAPAFKFDIISGPATIENGLVTFNSVTSNTMVVVRAIAFNGNYIDYNFEVFPNINKVAIDTTNINAYGTETMNILNNVSSSGSGLSGFKYIIKFKDADKVNASIVHNYGEVNGDGSSNEIYEPIASSNEILEYSNNNLYIKFDDVTEITTVKFLIYTNYSVDGDSCAELVITLKPSLKLVVNTKYAGLIAGGTENKLVAIKDESAYLNCLNDTFDDISVKIVGVNLSSDINGTYLDYDTNPQPSLNLQLKLSADKLSYILTSENIGKKIYLEIEISKKIGIKSYSLNYKVALIPNANFEIKYDVNGNTDKNSYHISGAAVSDITNAVSLNEIGLLKVLDASGQPIIADNINIKLSTINGIKINGVWVEDQSETDKYYYTNINNSNVSIVVKPVNTRVEIRITLVLTWLKGANEVEYEQFIYLTIEPNITKSLVSYNSADKTSLILYAGTDVAINFAGIVSFNQGSSSAIITAQQTSKIGIDNINIVLKETKNDYFAITKNGSNDKGDNGTLKVSGLLTDTAVSFEVYYDLLGIYKGVLDASNVAFTDSKKLYNSGLTVNIKIVPAINTLTFNPNTEFGKTEQKPINLTARFNLLYKQKDGGIEYDINNKPILRTDNYYPENGLMVNEINISKLFDFNPVTGITFINEADKISSELSRLYLHLNFEITGKNGIDAANNAWAEAQECVKLEVIEVNSVKSLVAVFIPPTTTDNKTYFSFEINISLNGTGQNQSQKVYFSLNIGNNKGEIFESETITGENNDMLDYINNGIPLTITADGKSTEINLNNEFKFGYVIRTETAQDVGVSNVYNPTTNIMTLNRNQKINYAYVLNNVKLSFVLNDSKNYASIENDMLKIEPYYTDKPISELKESDFRKITLSINAGVVNRSIILKILPIVVRHEVALAANNVDIINRLITVDGNVELTNVTNKAISVNNAYSSWIKTTDIGNVKNYTFEPDLYQVSESVELKITGNISVGGDNAILDSTFSNDITQTVLPKVNVEAKTTKVKPNTATGSNLEYTLVASSGTYIINSNIFASNVNHSNISVMFYFTNSNVKYNDYILVNNSEIFEDPANAGYLTPVNVTNSTKLQFKANNLISDVNLPVKIVVSFDVVGRPEKVVFEKTFNIVLETNAGIINLNNSLVINPISLSDTTANITSLAVTTGLDVKIIGNGTFDYDIGTVNAEGSFATTNLKNLIKITPQLVEESSDTKKITQINLDWSQFLLANTSVTKINGITIKVYYKLGGNGLLINDNVYIKFIYKS